MVNEVNRDPANTKALAVVRSFYEHLQKDDIPAVLRLLDAQVKWTEAEGFPYYSGTWTGPNAVFDNLLKRLAVDWDDFTATPLDYITEGARVVSIGEYSGRFKRTGRPMRASFAHVWSVENEKIISFLMFADTAKVREAMAP